MSCLGILFIDLLLREILGEKLASAKCIKEEKVGPVTELLSTVLDKRGWLQKPSKNQLAGKIPDPVILTRGRG